jgi:hypothetical protein
MLNPAVNTEAWFPPADRLARSEPTLILLFLTLVAQDAATIQPMVQSSRSREN